MKFTLAAATATTILFVSTVSAAPTDGATYASYGSYQWANGAPVNDNQVSKENIKPTDKPADMTVAAPDQGGMPFVFTSTYNVVALGSEVRNGTVSVSGPSNAIGYFNYGINSHEDTICYNITLLNVAGTYQSPAKTATHIHEAARGASGPPRLAFPNPVGDDHRRISVGCMTGSFTTGLNGADGKDTGMGFKVSQIEANPAGFFTDSHTNLFPLGVIRGQLA